MVVLPPGTLLQLMYLEERLRRLPAGRFVEVGPGSGEITALLLRLGWAGASYDLEPRTIAALSARFPDDVRAGRLRAVQGDFVALPEVPAPPVDLIISCMVMEHMDDSAEARFMRRAAACLAPHGLMIGLVPGSPEDWGIEDDIAGHCRRYSIDSLSRRMSDSGWVLAWSAGLTFPVSNLLLPVSNWLVRRAEASKMQLSALERTMLSGRRKVAFKTYFPSLFGLLLNRATMAPLHWLQKRCSGARRALVIYFEAAPDHGAEPA